MVKIRGSSLSNTLRLKDGDLALKHKALCLLSSAPTSHLIVKGIGRRQQVSGYHYMRFKRTLTSIGEGQEMRGGQWWH